MLVDASGSNTATTRLLRPAQPRLALRRHVLAIVVAAVFGIALSLAGSYAIFHWEDRASELEFNSRVNNVTSRLQAGMDEYLNKIVALRALFNSSDQDVSRTEFEAFTQDLFRGLPAILSGSWIPRVTHDERADHEIAAMRAGFADYRITAILDDGGLAVAPERDEYFPVYYTTEKRDAATVMGLNMLGGRGEDSLKRARDSGELAASKVVVLHSGTGNRRGFFVLSPVYAKGTSRETLQDRRRNVNGFVQGVFQVDPMVESILGTIKAPVDLYIFAPDSGAEALPIHIFSSSLRLDPAEPKPVAALTSGPHWSGQLRVADLRWQLVAVPFAVGSSTTELMGFVSLFSGLFVTTIVIAYLWSSARHAQSLLRANQKVSELAQTDALTSLANRRAFMERLVSAFAASERGASSFALLYIDLDHFKDVNDTLGHPIGDLLLQQAAERLKGSVRECDLVARFGGDEFAFLEAGTSDLAGSGVLAAKIVARLGEPYFLNGNEVHVTASIGIARCGAGIAEPETAMMQADLALYRAKENGRNGFSFHSEELDRRVQERVSMGDELRHAVGRGELELHYQPQVDIASGEILGLEALLRWHHPKRGLLTPSLFLPIAEKTGDVIALGKWVFEEACRQQKIWEEEGIAPTSLAVNLSAVQCKRPDLDTDMREALQRWNVDPKRIEIELKEQLLLEPAQSYGALIARLRGLGVTIALDDFGTGYSSLDYLTRYPVDRLKIGEELVFQLTGDARHATMVRSAIRLAEELGVEIIAEGVETAGQALFLVSLGCRYAQGSHFGRPMSARQATELLRARCVTPGSAIRELEGLTAA